MTWLPVVIVSLALATRISAIDPELLEKFMEKMQQIGEECTEETHASTEDIADLLSKKIPASHEGKCMIFCFNRHLHLQKDDGSIDRTGALKALKEIQAADPEIHHKVMQIFLTCGARVKPDPDPCLFATDLAECAKVEAEAVKLDMLGLM